ncbi:MAG TPA: (Fe-S)-binding protein, partial [Chondromyces sp.]|nr:(Fe-S)-binding protein [Chondromyces sp.]
PADFLEMPKSPFTGTVFSNAASTKMVHICEFTSDLLRHNKLKFDKSRNDKYRVTFHDSCNPARAVGLLEEPRYVLKSFCNHFYEMPENTIREHTFCCAGGAGLGNDENMEMRLRGGLPRGNALRWVRDHHDVNLMTCICAIDRATLPPLANYWAPGVEVAGIHELVGNALIMEGENERETDIRGLPLKPAKEEQADV